MSVELKQVPLPTGVLNGEIQLEQGKICVISGVNGVGKSSLFQYFKEEQGKLFNGQHCAFIPQEMLNPLGDQRGKDLLRLLKGFYPKNYSQVRVEKFLNQFQFQEQLEKPISLLSGGQNQILKVLSAYAMNPDIYFFDEAFNHLDGKNKDQLQKLIKSIRDEKKTILMIDHHEDIKNDLADIHYILENLTSDLTLKRIG